MDILTLPGLNFSKYSYPTTHIKQAIYKNKKPYSIFSIWSRENEVKDNVNGQYWKLNAFIFDITHSVKYKALNKKFIPIPHWLASLLSWFFIPSKTKWGQWLVIFIISNRVIRITIYHKMKDISTWDKTFPHALMSILIVHTISACLFTMISTNRWPLFCLTNGHLENHLACSTQGSSPASQLRKPPPQKKHLQ